MIIKDLNGRDFEILNLKEFKHHIIKYHTKKLKFIFKNIKQKMAYPTKVFMKKTVIILELTNFFSRNYLLEKNLIFN